MEKLKLKRHSAGLFTPGPEEREEATRGYGVVFLEAQVGGRFGLDQEESKDWEPAKGFVGSQRDGLGTEKCLGPALQLLSPRRTGFPVIFQRKEDKGIALARLRKPQLSPGSPEARKSERLFPLHRLAYLYCCWGEKCAGS